MHVSPRQPFYHVLPDEIDCVRIFGAPRISKYVAQENVDLVGQRRNVVHRALQNYFTAFNADLARCGGILGDEDPIYGCQIGSKYPIVRVK
jgi:Hemimethylated DNA-binding protein YccV like